ncbi:hypothetical protein P8625_08940 [Tenacibaculum tangerinum]|uniref:Uncharacterized protein n=1 Tax=Tenacibaculum tangerinum TaxID=3038772 RepID=A0ABY8KYC9_9FLAO|nr:hypothetical protein [Tenacibaculum tangerinum]WGH74244.1 hypothetical protein P8625_08940 [Tenacibaculum tangerinum]
METPKVIQQIANAPLPMMLEKLGMSIANAQSALDANSIRLANEMASIKVNVGDEEYNLLSLGFTPTFYAFTEASLEMKMEFSMAESENYGGAVAFNYGKSKNDNSGGEEQSGNTSTQMFGVSVSAHYSRKFSASAEGSSSIAAKIVSLPPPDIYLEILKSTLNKEE